jgi:hypothetical protein
METLGAYVRENSVVAKHRSDEAITVLSLDSFSLDAAQTATRD